MGRPKNGAVTFDIEQMLLYIGDGAVGGGRRRRGGGRREYEEEEE